MTSRRPRMIPRAGVAEPRVPMPPRPTQAPRPDVAVPVAWTPNVRKVADMVLHESVFSLLEEAHPEASTVELMDMLPKLPLTIYGSDETKREVYERACQVLRQNMGLGTPRDRAEVRLLTWLRLYENYEG